MVVLLVLVHGLAGCSAEDRASAPSAPSPVLPPISPPPVVGPPGLRGSVSDTAFRPLAGARVEIVDGPRAGESVTADSTGTYALAGPFSATDTIRATKEGYVPGIRTFSSSAGPFQNQNFIAFSLNVLAAPVNIAGDYTLTLLADGACAQLPEAVRMRTYAAVVTPEPRSIYYPDNTLFNVAVSGAAFVGPGNFSIGVAGNDLGIWVSDPRVVERLGPTTYLAMEGEARATTFAPVSTISAAFSGAIEYCESTATMGPYDRCNPPGGNKAVCESKNHRMVFSRR